ncbi:MAG: hypothetical protein M3R49_10125 [Chloroflexota bacterium]|nr:hypothetical protein [Chloroflexota bacterium]
MAKHEEASCAHCLAVIAMLHSQFQPTDPRHFSGIGQRYPGWSDRPAGVQWSLWHDRPQSRVVLAVNLEGMADGDAWPIGQVIEKECADPQLPALALQSATEIEVWLGRDVWNPSGQGKIGSDDFVACAINLLTKDKWLRAVEEARSSQNPTHDGRGTREVLLKKGVKRVCDVSPHLQFVLALWGSSLPGGPERTERVTSARRKLEPIHAFLLRTSA